MKGVNKKDPPPGPKTPMAHNDVPLAPQIYRGTSRGETALVPVSPVGPLVPVSPVGPFVPVSPVGPFVPVSPVGPLVPVSPVGPFVPRKLN